MIPFEAFWSCRHPTCTSPLLPQWRLYQSCLICHYLSRRTFSPTHWGLRVAKRLPLKDGFRFCRSSVQKTAEAGDCPQCPLICLNPKHQMVTAICFFKLILQCTHLPPWTCQHPKPEAGGAKSPSRLCLWESYLHPFKCCLFPAGDSNPSLTYPFQQAYPGGRSCFLVHPHCAWYLPQDAAPGPAMN